MNKGDQEKAVDNLDEVSVKDIFSAVKSTSAYLKSKWILIVSLSIIGAFAGLMFSIFIKPDYTATCTFVLEESGKGGGGALGQYAGLASLAGIDLGGVLGGSGGGMFQGDNIIELYKSRIMLEKTLLSKVNINGKEQLLIDRYIDFNKLRTRWKNKDDMDDKISFTENPANFTRTQDSIITDIVTLFNKKVLSVKKVDKKLSIIKVEIVSKDELFAKYYTLKLVETVNNFYSLTKTKKSNQNLKTLQHQADSVRKVLDYSINGVASAIEASPNANPTLFTLKVPSQKKQIDVQANTAIYTEIVKNLEISKLSLRQETPLIQVIDQPVLPLQNNRLSKLLGVVCGLVLGMFIAIAGLVCKSIYLELKA